MHQAASLYQKTQQATVSPRQLESRLLLKAASRLEAISREETPDRDALREALAYNKKLWTIFVSAVTKEDSELPKTVRENITNLGLFVFKHSITAERNIESGSLKPLVNINREVAAGLRA
ncbi:MAG: flagellar protein FlaF [Hyphomicrobiales bacterium]|nr:MAG: flagellar protein FlaF [Hyphomicrobiales bacterium]